MTDPGVDLTVAIVVRDGADTLGDQLAALSRSRWDGRWEVLVVDDGSRDATADVARGWQPRLPSLRVLAAGAPGGASHARNVAVAAAAGAAVAFCDADDIVGDRWVAAMGEALARHDYVTGPLELERLNPRWVTASRGLHFGRSGGIVFAGLFPFAAGANLGLRRAIVERLGPFPTGERFHDDVHVGLQAYLAGIPLHVAPEAVVHYRYRSTMPGLARQAYGYGVGYTATCRKLRAAGAPHPGRLAGLRAVGWAVRSLPKLRTKADVAGWTWAVGGIGGRIAGSVRQRSFFL